ncbi:MAG: hypothetical protein methR_P0592 [Methyloprofundus sp.]|nr:MAG: hypothetical protein methR_P0592 [Methyloprofundus sp.]
MENDVQTQLAQFAQFDSKFNDLYQQGHFEEAIPYAKEICVLCEQYHGANDINTLTSIENLASLYRNLLNYDQAELLYKQTLNIRQETLGMEHLDTAYSLNKLGLLYYDMGNFSKATPLFQQALKIREQELGNQDVETATSQNNLAMIYHASGEYKLAEPLYLKALKTTQEECGYQHSKTAMTLNNCALLYADMGNYKQAEKYCKQALEIRLQILGEHHPDTARSLDGMAGIYHDMGNYVLAEPLYVQALKICEDVYGKKHPDTALKLSNLALFFHDKGDYEQAISFCLQALKIRKEIFGDHYPETSTSLNNLAGVYKSKGDYDQAETLFLQALKIYKEMLGKHHPHTANTLTNLAGLYQDMGDYSNAERLFQQGLIIRQQSLGDKHPDTATSLNNLALLYNAMGNYDKSESLNQQALKIRQEALGTQHPDTATSLNNLALIYFTMGDYGRAEQLFKQGLKIRQEVFGDLHPVVADSLNNLAQIYIPKGDFDQAEGLNQQALEINQKVFGEQHLYTSTSFNNLAMMYHTIGNYGLAWSNYEKALKIIQDKLGDHLDTTVCLINLAVLYHDMGNYKKAEPLYQQALNIFQDKLGEKHLDYAHTLHNLAGLHVARDKFDLALDLKLQACAIENEIIGQLFQFANETQRTLYVKKNKYSLSAFLSLVYFHLADNADAVSSALNLVLQRKAILAEALVSQRDVVLGGQYPELQSQFETLSLLRMQIAQKTLAGPGKGTPEIHRKLLAQWNTEKEQLESKLARQIPEMRLDEKLGTAGLQAIASKITASGTLVEFVRFDVFDFKAIPAKGESQWQPARYLAFIIPASDPDTVNMIDLGEAAPIDHLIAEFRSQITDPSNQRGFDQLSTSPLPAVVPGEPTQSKKTGLFSHWLGRIKADQTSPSHRDLGAIQQPLSTETHEQAGYKLYELLFMPLQKVLGENTRLLLSPDGDLTRLPFEVLPTEQGGRLIDHYDISYLAVGRDVLRFGEKSGREPAAPLVLADPDFDLSASPSLAVDQNNDTGLNTLLSARSTGRYSRDFNRADLHFGQLPGTQIEGERIADLLDVKPWTDVTALESDLKNIRSPVILHLATHGFFLEDQKNDPNQYVRDLGSIDWSSNDNLQRLNAHGLENPLLRSGLALAGVNTWLTHGNPPEAAEDGLLTAEDVTGLNLLDTELVVLSACETGLGEVQVGEGVLGLRRSFILAGAKTLIMSLWKVPDLATAILMERLYQNLLKKHLPRDQALREAQRYLSQVTVGEIRKDWLNKQTLKKLSAGNQEAEKELKQLTKKPNNHQPFQHPLYWGAFICQGDTEPLPSLSKL